jgi:hypothetical protein
MGVNRTPQPDSTTLDVATCPACASAEQPAAFRTQTTVYFICRVCDHIWAMKSSPVETFDGYTWTSLAFRITRRKLSRQPQ